ncbi:MAG: rRNA maturation RNase YbeY [Prevotellaceae bacterium]|jgi:rRNA maturation RNase YbeY|nr:rRNA maturation RNase YbeY [Prevotellaceae bacterium]
MLSFYSLSSPPHILRRRRVKKWLTALAEAENRRVGEVSIIFCSDEELLALNRRYLQHDYFTDVLTFDYSDGNRLSGDIFISCDTVRANARDYSQPFDGELRRVMAHGLLHLCGYRDATVSQQRAMRAKENHYLAQWNLMNDE